MENSKNLLNVVENDFKLSIEMENSKNLLNVIENDLELSEINGGGLLGSIIGAFAGGCSWGNMFTPGPGRNPSGSCVPR